MYRHTSTFGTQGWCGDLNSGFIIINILWAFECVSFPWVFSSYNVINEKWLNNISSFWVSVSHHWGKVCCESYSVGFVLCTQILKLLLMLKTYSAYRVPEMLFPNLVETTQHLQVWCTSLVAGGWAEPPQSLIRTNYLHIEILW